MYFLITEVLTLDACNNACMLHKLARSNFDSIREAFVKLVRPFSTTADVTYFCVVTELLRIAQILFDWLFMDSYMKASITIVPLLGTGTLLKMREFWTIRAVQVRIDRHHILHHVFLYRKAVISNNHIILVKSAVRSWNSNLGTSGFESVVIVSILCRQS